MTAIETIAFIFIIVGLVKLITLTINPGAWISLAKKIWRKSQYLSVIYLIVAAIIFYYLIQELTILQILATAAFVSLLFGLQFSRYSKETLAFIERVVRNKGNYWKNNWFYALIWLTLLIWGLTMFF